MARDLAAAGITICGWPAGVALPADPPTSGEKPKGIAGLPLKSRKLLMAALSERTLTFRKYRDTLSGMCAWPNCD